MSDTGRKVEYALGGEFPDPDHYPRDKWDLAACQMCRDNAPKHLWPRMDEALQRYKSALRGGDAE